MALNVSLRKNASILKLVNWLQEDLEVLKRRNIRLNC